MKKLIVTFAVLLFSIPSFAEQGNETQRIHDQDGNLIEVVSYHKGKVRLRSKFLNGKKHGVTKTWYITNGKFKKHTYFEENFLHGEQRRYHENGNLQQKAVFDRGIEKNRAYYDQDGKKHGFMTKWNKDGTVKMLKKYQHGKLLKNYTKKDIENERNRKLIGPDQLLQRRNLF